MKTVVLLDNDDQVVTVIPADDQPSPTLNIAVDGQTLEFELEDETANEYIYRLRP